MYSDERFHALQGDFYREPEITRGITLDDNSFDVESESAHWYTTKASALDSGFELAQVRFRADDMPPNLPTDPYFQLERTTIHVEGRVPFQVGNSILSFLADDMDAQITKVTLKKYAIKAEVALQGTACELKVRMYRQSLDLVLEFQRRSGDAIVFSEVYRRVSQHLK